MRNNPYDFKALSSGINPSTGYSDDPMVQEAIMSGMSPRDAMMMAAEFRVKDNQAQQYQYQVEKDKREAMQQELMQQRLGQLGINDPFDVEGNFERLIQAGVDPSKAGVIATQISESVSKQQQAAAQAQQAAAQMQNINKEDKKFLMEAQQSGAAASDMISSLNQMEKLIDKAGYMGTGAGIASVWNEVSDKKASAATQKFESLSNQIVLSLAEKLKGALSDKDINFLMKTAPNIYNTKQGNKQIIKHLRTAAERAQEHAIELKKWVDNGGSVQDFEGKWNEYIASNPLFNVDEDEGEE